MKIHVQVSFTDPIIRFSHRKLPFLLHFWFTWFNPHRLPMVAVKVFPLAQVNFHVDPFEPL